MDQVHGVVHRPGPCPWTWVHVLNTSKLLREGIMSAQVLILWCGYKSYWPDKGEGGGGVIEVKLKFYIIGHGYLFNLFLTCGVAI